MFVDSKDLSQNKVFFNRAVLLVFLSLWALLAAYPFTMSLCTGQVCYFGDNLISEDMASFILCICPITPLAATPHINISHTRQSFSSYRSLQVEEQRACPCAWLQKGCKSGDCLALTVSVSPPQSVPHKLFCFLKAGRHKSRVPESNC